MSHRVVRFPSATSNKQKEEDPAEVAKRTRHEYMALNFPRSAVNPVIKTVSLDNKGFNWTAEVTTTKNENDYECLSIKLQNMKWEESDCWYCDASLSLMIPHKDQSKSVFQNLSFYFTPTLYTYTFSNVINLEDFLADPGFFNESDSCFITVRVTVNSMNGKKFLKKFRIDWSEEATGSDVCLIVEGAKFYVGKHLLVRNASYFDSMFYGSFKESTMDTIEMKDLSKDNFELFLNYIHSCGTTMNADTVWGLVEMAHIFDASGVLVEAEKFLCHTDEITYNERLVMADKYGMHALKERCFNAMDTLEKVNRCRKFYGDYTPDTQERLFMKMCDLTEIESANKMQYGNNQYPPHMQPQMGMDLQSVQPFNPSTSQYQQPQYLNNNNNRFAMGGPGPSGMNQGPSNSFNAPPPGFYSQAPRPTYSNMGNQMSYPMGGGMMGSNVVNQPFSSSSYQPAPIPPPPALPFNPLPPPIKKRKYTRKQPITAAIVAASLASSGSQQSS